MKVTRQSQLNDESMKEAYKEDERDTISMVT